MALNNRQKLSYYQNKDLAKQVILNDAAVDNHIIYGAQAINAQLPTALQKPTEDYDIFSKTPKKDAKQIEKALDRNYGGDFFSVTKAKYPNTWKVKSNVTKKTVVDYTYPSQKNIPSKNIGSNKYAKLGWIKSNIRRTLNKKTAAFRFEKDNEALQRIELYEKNKDFLFG